ncbi:helicase associated domain-containing protein, partial [Kitasatospora nipponensis]|uniref:helicase associated domain-containing protein n=1 Tax=Kitasatospora nipponensis TaxID=258049 RepID=UPI0031D93BD6
TILKNLRTAQRRTEALEKRAEAGETGLDWAGALTAERKAALDAIDPAWCPAWPVEWQRCFALAWRHVKADGSLAGDPGAVVVQGEDLTGWARAQRIGWDKLGPAQQWLCEHVLGLEPLAAEQLPPAKVSHAEKERRNLAAAAQYRKREGNLNVGRKHKEPLTVDDGTKVEVSLGLFITNSRLRRATIPAERAARLTELGMRWE